MTVILVRHGRSTANSEGLLAGRMSGVELDEYGRTQANELPQRLASVIDELTAVAHSPLLRCSQTVAPLVGTLMGRADHVPVRAIEELNEVEYGHWTGRQISDLTREPLWQTVLRTPAAVTFPAGESMAAMSVRAVGAIRQLDSNFGGQDGSRLWLACTHADIIKAVLADALGSHLDTFHRIVIDTASISVVRYTDDRAYVHTMNSTQPSVLDARRGKV